MQRIKENFLDKLNDFVPLAGKRILEVGCGDGARSVQIAERCSALVAVEPNIKTLEVARRLRAKENITYQQAEAEQLSFSAAEFDMCIFTLSLHHVGMSAIPAAINEAARVTKKDGYIVFLEPDSKGSFFEAEIKFNACDGDERKEKAFAYFSMLNHPAIVEIKKLVDETIFQFDSVEDFVNTMSPKKNREHLGTFLKERNFILNAERRINIFKLKTSR